MSLFAHMNRPQSPKYQQYFAEERWTDLLQQFRRNNFVINSLASQSLLSITLQAGLSALKSPKCYIATERKKDCPVCTPHMNGLADGLPRARVCQ